MSLCVERIIVQQLFVPCRWAQAQEMSSQAWEREASTTSQGMRDTFGNLSALSARTKVSPGTAQEPGSASAGWFISLSLWASHLENGGNDTYQQDVIKTSPKGGQAQLQCLTAGFHQACSVGEGAGALGKSSL